MEAAVQAYLKKCRIRNLNEKTMENYAISLTIFRNFYKGDLNDLCQDDIDDYTCFLMGEDYTPTTINNKLRDLRAFVIWCQRSEYVDKAIKVSLISQNEPEIAALNNMDLKNIYEACLLNQGKQNQSGEQFCCRRNYTIMRMLEETGMRISECLNLRINDVNFNNGTVFLAQTKNKKSRNVYLTPGLSRELKTYLELRQQFLSTKKLAATSVFCNNQGGQLKINTIQHEIRRYGEIAGIIHTRVSPHTFRHTFAKNFLLNGGDIFTLKDILGHSTLIMVYRYSRLWDAERQQKFNTVMANYTRSKKLSCK